MLTSVSGGYGGALGRLCLQTPRNMKGRATALAAPDWGVSPLTRTPCLPLMSPATGHPSDLGGGVSGHRALDMALGRSSSVDHGLGGSMALEARPGEGPARTPHVNSVQMRPVWG